MDERRERVLLETERYRIWGSLTLSSDGYRSRVSDMLNASERPFIALTDVTIEPIDGGEPTRHAFLALARSHVVYAVALGGE